MGRDAIHSARMDPARFEPNPKRRVDEGRVLLGDKDYAVSELITAVLARVQDELRRTVGNQHVDVTLTCPATWGATRRLVLSDSAEAAGFGKVRLVPEPVAAATYFSRVLGRDVPIGSVVVVHDFGAGTFDASVVARTSDGFDVLAVDGRDDIGGLDVDELLVKHIGTLCADKNAETWRKLEQPQTLDDRRARHLLWDDAKNAKERLSRAPSADVAVPLLDLDIHLTREELERLAKPLLEQTVRVTSSVIRWANLSDGRIAGVFLVGGSSRIPLMATLLHRALGEAPVAIEQPELVVAEGSMLAGEAAEEAGQATPALTSTPIPALAPVSPPVPGALSIPAMSIPAVSGPPLLAPPVPGGPFPPRRGPCLRRRGRLPRRRGPCRRLRRSIRRLASHRHRGPQGRRW